jgi:hypothetical protein
MSNSREGLLFKDGAWVRPQDVRIELDPFGKPKGGSYWGRRSSSGKWQKLSLATTKRYLIDKPEGFKPAGKDFEAVSWSQPEWTAAGEGKWRAEAGWAELLWDWGRGLHVVVGSETKPMARRRGF